MRSLNHSLPLTLLRAREAVMERFRPHLHAHGVTEQQWRVLRALAEEGESEAGALARRVCLLTPSLSRILRDLRQAGLLTSRKHEHDRRVVLATLTPKGRVLFARMSEESEAIYAALEARIGRDAYRRLGEELESLIARIDAAAQDDVKPAPTRQRRAG